MRIIDLSTEIKPGHVRWETERTAKGDTDAGDQNQVTTIKVSCHAFTHVDAQRHYFGGTPTIEATPLDALVGPAIIVDLMDTEAMEAIGAEKLSERADVQGAQHRRGAHRLVVDRNARGHAARAP